MVLALILVFLGSMVPNALAASCADSGLEWCIAAGNTKCKNNNPYKCQWVGSNLCYKKTATCSANQICNDTLTSGAKCYCNSSDTYTYKCDSDDVYYYNKCNERKNLKQDCGNSGYTGSNYCSANKVYKNYVTRGCSGNACTQTTTAIQNQKLEEFREFSTRIKQAASDYTTTGIWKQVPDYAP